MAIASAKLGEDQLTGEYTPKLATLWWEEDFVSGKVVPFPDEPSSELGVCAPSLDTECVHPSDFIGKDLECALQAGDTLKGFHLSSVPSLTNLCINGILAVCNDPEKLMAQLPPGLVSLLRRQQERILLEKIQLKWLLTDLRHRESYLNFYLGQSIDAKKVFLRGCRPVWDTDLAARQHLYRGYTFIEYQTESCSHLPVAVEGWEDSSWCIAAMAHAIHLMLPRRLALGESSVDVCESLTARLQGALVAAIARVKDALMKVFPRLVEYIFEPALAYVWWSRGELSKTMEMFLRLSDKMPNSPDGVPLEFGTGPIQTLGCQKALYLNEIARLHMYCNQPEHACDFYQRADDVCAAVYPSRATDCRMQSLLLMASAYDQGQMSNELASRAAGAWDRTILDPECRPNVVQRAAESFLHCHCGYFITESEGSRNLNTTWLKEAKARLTELSAKAHQVNLHLSLILALLGEKNAAENAYMNYVNRYASLNSALLQRIPGAVSVFIGSDIKPHPWWVLSEWLTGEKKFKQSFREVKVLPLQWRRQLRHCSCDIRDVDGEYFDFGHWSKPYFNTADVQDDKLFLRLTKRGLTGCMTQNLPCLKQVVLDPLTGCVCQPEEFSEEEILPWSNYQVVDSGQDVIKFNFSFDTFIPTPVQIYQNSGSGVTVSFLTWHEKKTVKERLSFNEALDQEEGFVGDILLNYSGLDGSHKLSLADVIIEAKREKIERQLISQGYDADPGVMEDASDFLDYCIRNSLQIRYSHVKTALDRESKPRHMLLDIKQHLGKKPAVCVNKTALTKKEHIRIQRSIACYGHFKPKAQVVVLQNVLHCGESTVVLALYTAVCTGMSSNDIDTLVFIDCSSRSTFVNPIVRLPDQPDALWRLSTEENFGLSSRKPGILTAVEYLMNSTESDQKQDTLVIFGAQGEIVQTLDIWPSEKLTVVANRSNIPDNHPDYTDMVLKTNKTQSRLRLVSTNGTIQFRTPPLGTIEHYVVVYSMVFVTLRDRILIMDSTTLTPVQIQHHGSQPASQLHLSSSQITDGVLITGERSFMKVLSVSKVFRSKKDACIQVIFGVANRVFVLQRSTCSQDSAVKPASSPVSVLANIKVPGVPTEACYITQHDGFVVSVSIFEDTGIPLYRENLYWFDMSGTVKGIHPFIGPGPHCLFVAQLGAYSACVNVKDNQGATAKSERSKTVQVGDSPSEKHWYLYFADGLGALCCIKLQDTV